MKPKPIKDVTKADIVRGLRNLARAIRSQTREMQQLRQQIQRKQECER